MKKIYRSAIFTWCSALVLMLSSCSGGSGLGNRSGEAPCDEGTSQVQMNVEVEGGTTFTSDQGYAVSIESGSISLQDITISALSDNNEEEMGVEMKGPYSINLLNEFTDLGFYNGNPGNYSTFSFLINVPDARPPLLIKGTALQAGQSYPFQAALFFGDRAVIGGLDIPLVVGHYKRLALVFEMAQWFDGIDFASASYAGRIINITPQDNPVIAKSLTDQVIAHMRIDIVNN